MEETFSTIAKEKRFSFYNSTWMENISWGEERNDVKDEVTK